MTCYSPAFASALPIAPFSPFPITGKRYLSGVVWLEGLTPNFLSGPMHFHPVAELSTSYELKANSMSRPNPSPTAPSSHVGIYLSCTTDSVPSLFYRNDDAGAPTTTRKSPIHTHPPPVCLIPCYSIRLHAVGIPLHDVPPSTPPFLSPFVVRRVFQQRRRTGPAVPFRSGFSSLPVLYCTASRHFRPGCAFTPASASATASQPLLPHRSASTPHT